MAESTVTDLVQEVADFRIDMQDFSDFLFEPANVMVTRRLAPDINSLQHYLDYLNAIKLVFTQETGDVTLGDKTVKSLSQLMLDAAVTLERTGGSVPYPTYNAMVADKAAITNKVILEVLNDTDATKNGKYTYDGVSVFTKSAYDPLTLAKADATVKANAAVVTAGNDADAKIAAALAKSSSTFDTLALLTASSLVDNAYALVANDTDLTKNGHYKKLAGVWTKVKYDPLAQAKSYADAKSKSLSEMASGLSLTAINMVEEAKGQYSTAGVFVADTTLSTSTSIAVKANECYVLTNLNSDSTVVQNFSLFNSAGVFVGTIGTSRIDISLHGTQQAKELLKVGFYNNESSLYNVGVIIPADGFIRVTYKTSGVINPLNKAGEPPVLYKSDYPSFLKLTNIQAPFEVLSRFAGTLKSVVIDSALTNNSNIGFKLIPVLGETVTMPETGHFVSEKMPITAGQYIHLHTFTFQVAPVIIFEDAAGKYLGQQNIVSEFTLGADSSSSVPLNVKSNFTGFFRVQNRNIHATPFLVGVTDDYVTYPKNYLTKSTKNILFYSSMGNKLASSEQDYYHKITFLSAIGNSGSAISEYTQSIPYILKKGDVLEYELDATIIPMLALLTPSDKVIADNINNIKEILPLLANEVVSIEKNRLWQLAGAPTTPKFTGTASSGKVAYYNDETDVIVVFFRPNKFNALYTASQQKQSYDINIMTKDDYIVKRDAELADRFKKLSAYRDITTTSSSPKPTGTYAAYPVVLMFKGEIINYLTAGSPKNVAVTFDTLGLRKTANQVISDIASQFLKRYVSNPVSTAAKIAYQQLPIKIGNPLSYHINQVYAHTNCLLHTTVNYLKLDASGDLDVENLVKNGYFKPRIMKLKDAVINDNLVPFVGRGLAPLYSSATPASVYANVTGASDCIVTFAAKGASLESGFWTTDGLHTASVGGLVTASSIFELPMDKLRPVSFYPAENPYAIGTTDPMLAKIGFTTTEPSLVTVFSKTNLRDVDLMMQDGSLEALNIIDASKPYMVDAYEMSLKTVTASYVKDNYEVTKETLIDIPDTKGLSFNFCTQVSKSEPDAIYTVLQILIASKVVAVLYAITENQGQSTRILARKNVNMIFLNRDFKPVRISFDGVIDQDEMVLKSYLLSDKAHYKDAVSSEFWLSLRNSKPYPYGGVFPKSVFENLSYPYNQVARGSTLGFPVKQYRGGKFYSLASVRYKKKRENYAMVSSNRQQILIQADWEFLGQINWNTVQLGNFEVRNPKMSGYVGGASQLPVAYADVQTNTLRIINWMKGVYDGTIDAKTTYQDFVDLDSLLDYCLVITTAGSYDGVTNNFLLGTYDASIWHFFWYDADQTWGSKSKGVRAEYNAFDANNFFRTISNVFVDDLKVKYRDMRNKGIIDARNIQALMQEKASHLSGASKVLDAKYWGEIFTEAGLPYSMAWVYKRVRYLDALYGYVEPNNAIVVQEFIALSRILGSQSEKVYTYTDRAVQVGDKLTVEYGDEVIEKQLVAVCEVAGVVKVTHTVGLNVGYGGGSGDYLVVRKGNYFTQ